VCGWAVSVFGVGSCLLVAGISPHAHDQSSTSHINITNALHQALRYLHSKGVLHRDLKPENLVFAAQAPRIAPPKSNPPALPSRSPPAAPTQKGPLQLLSSAVVAAFSGGSSNKAAGTCGTRDTKQHKAAAAPAQQAVTTSPEQQQQPAVFLVDMGLSAFTEAGTSAVKPTVFYGTREHSSVNMLRLGTATPVDDLIALGSALLELQLGALPWTGALDCDDGGAVAGGGGGAATDDNMFGPKRLAAAALVRERKWAAALRQARLPPWALSWHLYLCSLQSGDSINYAYLATILDTIGIKSAGKVDYNKLQPLKLVMTAAPPKPSAAPKPAAASKVVQAAKAPAATAMTVVPAAAADMMRSGGGCRGGGGKRLFGAGAAEPREEGGSSGGGGDSRLAAAKRAKVGGGAQAED